jgi:co-chaperonin GroES (HSP10)
MSIVKAYGCNVVVKPVLSEEAQKAKAANIAYRDPDVNRGEIVSLPEFCFSRERGEYRFTSDLKVGDVILFTYSQERIVDGAEYRVVPLDNVEAVVHP